jgi:hypothetical protein
MKKHTYISLLSAVLFSVSANAALYDRGNGLIYDDVLDITWLQDANYAQTSGYAAANATGGFWGADHIQTDGRMGWDAAKAWAAQLEYAGYSDWRLTSVGDNPIDAIYVTTSELGYMFYTNLGNEGGSSWDDPPTAECGPNCLTNVSFTDAASGGTISFLNVQSSFYWYQEESSEDYSWAFRMHTGHQGPDDKPYNNYAWAVADGDIAAVPLPAAAYLFGSALLGLFHLKRKQP